MRVTFSTALLIRYILCGDIFDLNKICGSAAVLYNELSYKSISDKVKQGMVQQCMR